MTSKATCGLFALLLSCGAASTASGQEGEVPPVELVKISDRLYEAVGGRGARGGVYLGDGGVVLIDAKQDKDSVEQLLARIRQLTELPLQFLINTHSDGDHVSGNRYYPRTITIVAHENCRKEFFHAGRDGTPSEWNDPALLPFLPSVTYGEKMDLYVGSKNVEIRYFGVGHTTGDSVVHFPEEKTAFLGDQVFLSRAQLIHSYKGGNSFEHVRTLTRMLEALPADRFCSGHDAPTDRNGVQTHIERMKQTQNKVKNLMDSGKRLDVVQREFPEAEARLVEAIFSEIQRGERP